MDAANMLQQNMDKTETLVLMNKSLRNPIAINKIKIDSITWKDRKKSWCYIRECFKLRSFCKLNLQTCLARFIQYHHKP